MLVDAGMSSQQRIVAPIVVHNRFAELAQEEIPEPGHTIIDVSEVPMTALDSTFCPCVVPVIVQDHGVFCQSLPHQATSVMADFGQTDFGQPSLASPFW